MARHIQEAYGESSIVVEPMLERIAIEPASDFIRGNISDNARSDILVMGFQQDQIACYIDICVTSPICQSNLDSTIDENIKKNEVKKRSNYAQRIQTINNGDFLPFVITSGGRLGGAANKIIRTIAK